MKQASIRTTVTIVAILVLAIAGVNVVRIMSAQQPVESPVQLSANPRTDVSSQTHAYVFPISETSYIPFLDSSRPRPVLTAKSAIVYDTQTSRFLYAQDTKKQLPIASLTKIMTAVVLVEHIELNDIVTITKESLDHEEVTKYLEVGERISVSNLMKMMLIKSSNQAAYALAIHARERGFDIIKLMNEKAQELGMADSLFLDPAGLNDNAHSTVQDLTKLVVFSLKYRDIWEPLQQKEVTVASEDGRFVHKVENTNQLLDTIPNISGGKTGLTDGALGCMILIVDIPGHRDKIISIILGSKSRFGDTQALVDWIIEAYRWE